MGLRGTGLLVLEFLVYYNIVDLFIDGCYYVTALFVYLPILRELNKADSEKTLQLGSSER